MSGTSRRGSSTSASRTSSTPRTTASGDSPAGRAIFRGNSCRNSTAISSGRRVTGAGRRQPAGDGMAQHLRDDRTGLEEPLEIDPGPIADVVEEVHQLLGGQVA